MSVVGFQARNHPRQIKTRASASDDVDDRRTPDDFWQKLHGEFAFTLDAAANDQNHKLSRYFTMEANGLEQPWSGERVWCNPPFSNLRAWVEKALHETERECPIVVMLLPDNRREQAFWQDLIEPVRDRGLGITTRSIRGRLKFGNADGVIKQRRGAGSNGSTPPFGCVLVIFEPCPRCRITPAISHSEKGNP